MKIDTISGLTGRYTRQKYIPWIMFLLRCPYIMDELRSLKVFRGRILIMSKGQRCSNRDRCISSNSSLV